MSIPPCTLPITSILAFAASMQRMRLARMDVHQAFAGQEAYPASVEVERLSLLIAIKHVLHVSVCKEDAAPEPMVGPVSCQLLHPAQDETFAFNQPR